MNLARPRQAHFAPEPRDARKIPADAHLAAASADRGALTLVYRRDDSPHPLIKLKHSLR